MSGLLTRTFAAAITIMTIAILMFASTPGGIDSYGAERVEIQEFQELITYDIWKHSNGTWQSTGKPGCEVSFNYTSSVWVDPEKKLVSIEVQYLKMASNHKWYDMSVKDALVGVKSYNSESVKYSVKTTLNANIAPLDIKQYSWQSASVEGYRYYIPVNIKVTYKVEEPEEIVLEPEEEEEGGGASSGDSGGSGGSAPEDPVTPVDPADPDDPQDSGDAVSYDVDADLILPDTGYAGHRVLMQDCSNFYSDDKNYSAYSFYKSGLGSNSFRLTDDSKKMTLGKLPRDSSGYYTDRYATFPDPGSYGVRLTAKVNGGGSGTDTEYIDILPVPDITVTTGGIRKENRKQILKMVTALDPDSTVKRAWVEISDKNGVGKVHIDCTPGSESADPVNSQLIKTRPVVTESVTGYYLKQYLEFMTKNENDCVIRYTVFVEDTEGKTDTKTGYISVEPDLAPEADIKHDHTVIRNKGTDIADIALGDISKCFGDDVERQWNVKVGGKWEELDYEDRSLGSGKSIVTSKEGVGPAVFSLTVTDIIPEDQTLSEYLGPSDRRSGTATATVDVINVSPRVDIDTRGTVRSEILVVASENDSVAAESEIEKIRLSFAEKGVDGEIKLKILQDNTSSDCGIGDINKIEDPFNYHAQWTSFEDSNFASDSRYMYKVNADFGTYGGGAYDKEPYPSAPYTVSAYSLENGNLIWSSSFGDDTLNCTNGFSVFQDDSEEFLYIVSSGKTLIVDKSEGSLLGTVSCELRGSCFVTADYFYSFSEKGIIRADRTSGKSESVVKDTVQGKARTIEGKVWYMHNTGSGIEKGVFDLKTGQVAYLQMSGTDGNYKGIDFDMYGNAAVERYSLGNLYSGEIWGPDCQRKYRALAGVYNESCTFVKDESGSFLYCGFTYHKRKNGKYYVSQKLESFTDGKSVSGYISSTSDYKTCHRFIYGYSRGGKVFLVSASEYYFVFDQGTLVYPERSYCFTCDLNAGTMSAVKASGDMSSMKGDFYEYGNLSDESLIMQVTEGNPREDGISGSTTAFAHNHADPELQLKKYSGEFFSKDKNVIRGLIVLDNGSLKSYGMNSLDDCGIADYLSSEEIKAVSAKEPTQLSVKAEEIIDKALAVSGTGSRKVFRKGEKVSLDINYSDYENDPSKVSYYTYYHCPETDGKNKTVNYIIDDHMNVTETLNSEPLTKPIDRFYEDGMYVMKHWQYDNTGNPDYDKKSNEAEVIFYIGSEGGGASDNTNSPPSIERIVTLPDAPAAGKALKLTVEIDDPDGDPLSLDMVVYKDGKPVMDDRKRNILPVSGKYPVITLPVSEKLPEGKYSIVVKVSDGTETDLAEKVFTVVSGQGITGMVSHTDQWDTNRKKYNSYLFGTEFDLMSDYNAYILTNKPRKRGVNVFWSEEKLILKAEVSGNPVSVTAHLEDTDYSGILTDNGKLSSQGNRIFEGYIWNSGYKGKWGSGMPAQAWVIFSAEYDDGDIIEQKCSIIMDDTDSYWRVHKLF